MTPGRPVPPPLAKPLPDLNDSHTDGTAAPTLAAAYGATAPDSGLVPLTVARRAPKEDDVEIAVEFCGLCHSDVHASRGEWGGNTYPLIPGHEVVGRVSRVGSAVDDFTVGERVGVGCMVDSCRECESCLDGLEQYCENGMTGTYGAKDRRNADAITQGGYATSIVVDRNYVLRVPEGMDPAAAAPLLCAGITTYSPLNHFEVEEGDAVGVVGLGGLGHMAVKIAHAMGAHVVLFTTSPNKREDGLRLGADEVIVSKNADEMATQVNKLDFILNTVAAPHDLDAFLNLLKRDGTMTLVGVPDHAHPSPSVINLIFKRRSLAGSLIGGIQETQEMLDFCARHGIVSDIEMIKMKDINEAYERMLKSDVKYRFVIDMATLKEEASAA